MRNVKLIVEYDSTRFYGWQKQPNLITVQGELEKAIFKLIKEKVKLIGSGRTDKGVHARGQVVNFHTNATIHPSRYSFALNTKLPDDIFIRKSEEADVKFHSRYSATGKEYKYVIYNNELRSPILRNYSYHVEYGLDLQKMRRASEKFLGTHDFSAFMSTGSSIRDTVRTIHDINIIEKDKLIEISFLGNGFLYNMVRIMVGTLVEIGSNRRDIEDIPLIIKSKNRKKAGHTAPAQGLYLERVFYD